MARPSSLSAPARELVLSALRKHSGPISAYDLLEKLRKSGIKSPPIIYRALESLMEQNAVHKIQATSEYIACDCDADHDHAFSVLTVCGECRKVNELHDHGIIHHLEKLVKLGVHLRKAAVIELPITCAGCAG